MLGGFAASWWVGMWGAVGSSGPCKFCLSTVVLLHTGGPCQSGPAHRSGGPCQQYSYTQVGLANSGPPLLSSATASRSSQQWRLCRWLTGWPVVPGWLRHTCVGEGAGPVAGDVQGGQQAAEAVWDGGSCSLVLSAARACSSLPTGTATPVAVVAAVAAAASAGLLCALPPGTAGAEGGPALCTIPRAWAAQPVAAGCTPLLRQQRRLGRQP